MPTDEKHFEQVPIEVMEKILREAAERAKGVERSPALESPQGEPASTEVVKEEGGALSKDHE
jgi:hypothetical protein